jgi:hypothetical protein
MTHPASRRPCGARRPPLPFSLPLLAVAVVAAACLTLPQPAAGQADEPDPREAARQATAQSAPPDTLTGWETDLSGRLSTSQAAYKDWQEGGINTLSIATALDGQARRSGEHWAQTYSTRLTFGLINQENGDDSGGRVRKSEDLIRVVSNLQYKGDGFFRIFTPTIAVDLRTQFAKGFNYSSNPYPEGNPRADDELPVQTSEFFSPAFITESIGLTYEPASGVSIRLGGASKQTVVLDDSLRVLYSVDPTTSTRVEAGAELAVGADLDLSENIRYQSNLNTFFSFNQTENPPDVIWENVISMSVNDWLSTNLEFVALYDKNTVDAIQLKEVLSVGISFDVI